MTKNGAADNNTKVTQKDVAERAGVSRAIVSYVINNGPRAVAPETRERVLQAIAELEYRPNKHAQNLMREQWGSVAERDLGLILPNVELLQRPYYGSIVASIHQTAHDNHYRVRFMRFFDELQNPALFNELVHREEISGLILMALDQCIRSEDDREIIKEIRARIANIVCLEWQLEGLPSVSFDRAGAARQATEHLLDLGYEDVIYLGLEDERIMGYHQAHIARSRPIPPQAIFYAHDPASGYAEVERVLTRDTLPRAIVAGSDEIAFGILRRLREEGVIVPQQIALASIDNIPMAAYAAPPLTTVNVPKNSMGRVAVDVLVSNGGDKPITTVTNLLSTQLIVRESCGAKALGDHKGQGDHKG